MKVRIKHNTKKSAPRLHYTTHEGSEFRKGQEIYISILNYPGKHHPWLANNQYTEWDFWVHTDVNTSPVFIAGDIDALILTPQERESLADAPFDSAPFEVIVRES